MKPCDVCGNPIDTGVASCPFCGSQQRPGQRGGGQTRRLITVNLEAGRPVVRDAVTRLDLRLDTARLQDERLVRVVHGYGSSGSGGAIRDAVRAHLKELRGRGLARSFVRGEEYPDGSAGARELFGRHPRLRATLRSDRSNPGITFVEL
jgi:hypothetical protein